MPLHSSITAISGTYPDIARNPDKYFLEKNVFLGSPQIPYHFS